MQGNNCRYPRAPLAIEILFEIRKVDRRAGVKARREGLGLGRGRRRQKQNFHATTSLCLAAVYNALDLEFVVRDLDGGDNGNHWGVWDCGGFDHSFVRLFHNQAVLVEHTQGHCTLVFNRAGVVDCEGVVIFVANSTFGLWIVENHMLVAIAVDA